MNYNGTTSMLSYLTNYTYINANTFYNFLIITLKSLSEESQREIIENIKIHLGLSWYQGFRSYTYRKLNHNHPLVILLD